jgi:DMSO/TMAO reductase YedYZ molybdopterin-dependent catalytic subunit
MADDEKPPAEALPPSASATDEEPAAPPPPPPKKKPSLADRLREPEEVPVELPLAAARARTRRDFLLFGAGALAATGGLWWLLPDDTRELHLTAGLREKIDSLEARLGASGVRREKFLNRTLTFDDDVAEALFSKTRTVRTYRKESVTPLRNNYVGTPKPGYIPGWKLTLSGLASSREESYSIGELLTRFPVRDQVTRICCVEGWSAIAWWGGFPFAELLAAFPPAPGSKWAKLVSAVGVDPQGAPDPYYVSIDLETARHPQALLATHFSGRPLPVEHGAPLRLVVPMKLGLKNIKAITSIEYSAAEPGDYWNERGYSKYDGL